MGVENGWQNREAAASQEVGLGAAGTRTPG